jgi:hypothetical protein
MWKVELSEQ